MTSSPLFPLLSPARGFPRTRTRTERIRRFGSWLPLLFRRTLVLGLLLAYAVLMLGLGYALERKSLNLPLLPVQAADKNQRPYPNGVALYYENTEWSAAIKAAAQQWNRADIGVRLQRTSIRQAAAIEIVQDPARLGADPCMRQKNACAAFVTGLEGSASNPVTMVLGRPLDTSAERHPIGTDVRLLVHEFGHTLGLEHTPPCTTMHPTTEMYGCKRAITRKQRSFCGPSSEAVVAAARRHGGRGRLPRQYCAEISVDDALRPGSEKAFPRLQQASKSKKIKVDDLAKRTSGHQ